MSVVCTLDMIDTIPTIFYNDIIFNLEFRMNLEYNIGMHTHTHNEMSSTALIYGYHWATRS